MKLDTTDFERKMKKSCELYETSLETIRVGRANAAVLSGVTVDYYGVETPINQVAEIKVPDPKTLLISPWDSSMVKNIERAILASNVGITPQNDGKMLRLSFPPLTEERRRELSKQVSKMGEDAKVNVRNIRRDGNDAIKKLSKSDDISEDEVKDLEDELQKTTDKFIKEIDSMIDDKSKDIMTV